MYPHRDYTRVGGWLLVFVIWSVLQALVNLVLGVSVLAVMPVSALFAILGHGVLRGAMVVLLLRRDRRSVRLLQIEAGVYVAEFLYTLALSLSVGVDTTLLLAEMQGVLVGGIAFYVGWLVYFSRSERVRVYFSGAASPYGAPPYGFPPQGGGYGAPPPTPDGTAHFCPRCGAPVENAGSLFCARCGAPLYPGKGGQP